MLHRAQCDAFYESNLSDRQRVTTGVAALSRIIITGMESGWPAIPIAYNCVLVSFVEIPRGVAIGNNVPETRSQSASHSAFVQR